jgi:hypothetical protein
MRASRTTSTCASSTARLHSKRERHGSNGSAVNALRTYGECASQRLNRKALAEDSTSIDDASEQQRGSEVGPTHHLVLR